MLITGKECRGEVMENREYLYGAIYIIIGPSV